MIIIHGEDIKKSYDRLMALQKKYKELGLNIYLHPAAEILPTALRQELGSTDLFETKSLVIIYGLISLTKSKNKDALIKTIQDNPNSQIILYEERELTATQLKSFPKAEIEVFKIPPVIFKFLETLRPGNQKEILTAYNRIVVQGTEPEFIFAMLTRQIRMLIQAKDLPSGLKTSPYAKKMFISQAQNFTMDQLINLHHHLYKIDKKIKTGNTPVETGSLVYHFLQSI